MNRTGEEKLPAAIDDQRPPVVSHASLVLALALANSRCNQQAVNKDQNTKPTSQNRHNNPKIEQCQSKL